ncbi:T9SS type A sorting domain-containing protein [candidate division KSB1 bacterium]|nr:T9SS type A sorting domain-containing protein [candidate division KSB1 bacterium]
MITKFWESIFKTSSHLKYLLVLMTIFVSNSVIAQVNIDFTTTGGFGNSFKVLLRYIVPLTMNVEEEELIKIEVDFSEDCDSLFLIIPDKPEFFTRWQDQRIAGPANQISGSILFKPQIDDGAQYIFKLIAGCIQANGKVYSDTFIVDLRVAPCIVNEPKFSGGTSNTISWIENKNLFDQYVSLIDPTNSGNVRKQFTSLRKSSNAGVVQTTFENLQHEVEYGYFIKGFKEDSTSVNSTTVISIQDAIPPDFLGSSSGMEGPNATVDLFWQIVEDATSFVRGFVIFRRMGMGSFVAIDSVFVSQDAPEDDFHFQDERDWGLIEGETFFYKVAAFDAGFNVGDGNELGPFVPDATTSPPPTFFWEQGFGFDFVPPEPHAPFPAQSSNEKPWSKKGTSNTVYLVNPKGKPGFEDLASVDFVRFQAVRDKSRFFDAEWQPGVQFFDTWISPWIPVDQFNGGLLFFNFDFTNSGTNDDSFIHGHFFKYRAQFRDKAGNRSEFSRSSSEERFIGAFQDVFPPGDISNLNIFVKLDSSVPGGGFIRLDWEAAGDSVSGVKAYTIHRKIGEDGEFKPIAIVNSTDGLVQSYPDTFANINTSTTVCYRISAEDNVGNKNDFNDSLREVCARAPLAPEIAFANGFTLFNNDLYTTKNAVIVNWTDFDTKDVEGMTLTVNGQTIVVDPKALEAVVQLAEGPNQIFANVQFANGIISPNSNTLEIIKDSTAPGSISLSVNNDPSPNGNMFLNWTNADDLLPVEYEIFRQEVNPNGNSLSKTSKIATFISLGVTSDTSFTDPYINADGSFLIAFQHYEYKVEPSDLLGNKTEASAATDEDYCNIAPQITSMSFNSDDIKIIWSFPEFSDSSFVPLDLTRFDIKLFRDGTLFREEFVIGKKMVIFQVDPGPEYCSIVRAVELQSSNLDSSALSNQRCTDTGKSIIPTNDILLTQAQPTDTTGIFVSWEFYFDNNFWDNNSRELVGFFRVIRVQINNSSETFEQDFFPGDPAYENLMYMDRTGLTPNADYVYQVIPFEKKVNDPPRFVPAGNAGADTANAKSNVKNFTDRVFIPKFNGLHVANPATGKKYFNINTKDSLRVEWLWLFEENGTERIAEFGDTRGAESVQVFLSNNPDFTNRPDFKQFTEIIELRRNLLTNIDQFYNTSTNDLTNPNRFNVFEGKSVFAKIMGFDRFGNSPDYPSSAELDGVDELILDNTLPSPTSLDFTITSSNDTSTAITLVDINFSWSKSTDDLAGLRDNEIQIFKMINGNQSGMTNGNQSQSNDVNESIVAKITNIPGGDSTALLKEFEILDEFFTQPLFFRIVPRDFADNINDSGEIKPFTFFSPPELISVERDSITNNVSVTWSKVQAADKYFLVFANQKSFFLFDLRDNPGNREIITANPNDPDIITKKIERIFNPDTTVFFRMFAIKGDIFESGWSNFFELLPSNQVGGGNNTTTDVEEIVGIPSTFALRQNYPNPFNPETTIEYDLPRSTQVEISIYNLAGKKIKTLIDHHQDAGNYRIIWDGRNDSNNLVASGVYLYKITTSEFQKVKKCLFLK